MHADRTRGRLIEDAKKIFFSGLRAVEADFAVRNYCRRDGDFFSVAGRTYDLSDFEHIYVVGAGKATAPMADAVEQLLAHRITDGLVIVKYGHGCKLGRVKIIEAGHPVPDEKGILGAKAILKIARQAGENDLVICLVSGGGSALMPLPARGLRLKDKQDTIRVLLACGATIHEINAIRKHLSLIKGGRLAQAVYPASLITLILSDVVGNDLDVIASGPTVADSSTFWDGIDIIKKYGLTDKLPSAVLKYMEHGARAAGQETPKAGDPVFEKVCNVIVGSNLDAIHAAKKQAEALGYHTLVLSSMIEGETRHVAHMHGAIAREVLKTGNPIFPPACILSGGETTVTLTGDGLGGRCQEFALAVALDISGSRHIVCLCGGTDGNDGPTDAAGAICDDGTVARAEKKGWCARRFLSNNDSYRFFKDSGELLITGPTKTNVMDLRIMMAASPTDTFSDGKNTHRPAGSSPC